MAPPVSDAEYRYLCSLTGAAYRPGKQPETSAPSKYHNKKVTIGDETFDSKGEAARWGELCLKQTVGLITDLKRQVVFSCDVNGSHICNYIADFAYMENGRWVVEDYKGVATSVYRLKKKLVEALHGVRITEVRKK